MFSVCFQFLIYLYLVQTRKKIRSDREWVSVKNTQQQVKISMTCDSSLWMDLPLAIEWYCFLVQSGVCEFLKKIWSWERDPAIHLSRTCDVPLPAPLDSNRYTKASAPNLR